MLWYEVYDNMLWYEVYQMLWYEVYDMLWYEVYHSVTICFDMRFCDTTLLVLVLITYTSVGRLSDDICFDIRFTIHSFINDTILWYEVFTTSLTVYFDIRGLLNFDIHVGVSCCSCWGHMSCNSSHVIMYGLLVGCITPKYNNNFMRYYYAPSYNDLNTIPFSQQVDCLPRMLHVYLHS